jgi:hypothetical protein
MYIGDTGEMQKSNFIYKKNTDSFTWCWTFKNLEDRIEAKLSEPATFYDVWHQFVLTYDGGLNERKVYVDGEIRAYSTEYFGNATAVSKLNLPAEATLHIGMDTGGSGIRYFEGHLRHFQLFDRVLGENDLYLLPKRWSTVNEVHPAPVSEVVEEIVNAGFPSDVGNGWTLVASIPGGSATWFEGDGHLNNHYGGEFLFATGDFSRWLIASHEQVNGGSYTNSTPRTVTKSSVNLNEHTVQWYNRSGNPEDPLISLRGHNMDPGSNMMYAENGTTGYTAARHSSGMFVYTRGGLDVVEPPSEVGEGWAKILSLPGDATTWWPGNGNLDGYTGGEFMFATGDYSRWLIASHDQVNGEFYTNSTPRTVTKSSANPNAHTVQWYNRSGNPEDPLISLKGHNVDPTSNMMFTENGVTGHARHSSGMFVYTRAFQ